MTANEIQNQIQQEYMTFNNSQYSGNPALPKDIIEIFKKAVFSSSPSQHQIPTEVIKQIISKKLKDLTNTDVPIILNTISSARFCDLYSSFEESLIKNGEIEFLKVSFNLMVKEINASMEMKKSNLMSLNGMGNGKIKSIAQA